ncbi:hypothetical protein GWK47_039546 [Chionoecetes opilio]|uniref:Uncharacterized protein n=1 Tax=Chionoecetes opilio TaxID=41210 RepID=A0A8J4YBH4_CHIOP|nr:hypothetical protein GWK47_039546 [Chionoecetes opilio]
MTANSATHPGATPPRRQALGNPTIISANVRGFQTNFGDLTYSHVLPHSPDIIATTETFLNSSVPDNFGQIGGYSSWFRRDRAQGTFGGVTVCFRNSLPVQALPVDLPAHMEMMFFKFIVTCRPLATLGSSDHLAVLTKIKLTIDRDEARWQVTFAPDKTQAVLISHRQDAVNWDQHAILLKGRKIHLQESVNILGVQFDSGFKLHQPRQEGRQGCCLETELHPTRRANSWTLRESAPLYKSQVAP